MECKMCDSTKKFPVSSYFYRPQRSWGKVMFLQVCVILFTGGGSTWPGTPYGTRYPPGPGTPHNQVHPPGTRYTPPRTRYTPLGPGTPPGTRYTPQDQVLPPDQLHPLEPGTHQIHPPDQVHPPPDQVNHPRTPSTRYPPRGTACWEIRSTRGRYASYWNAILFISDFPLLKSSAWPMSLIWPQIKFTLNHKCILLLFTARNSSCGKVMFSEESTGGCTSPRQTPPPGTDTAADGKHPRGMHACYHFFSIISLVFFLVGRN